MRIIKEHLLMNDYVWNSDARDMLLQEGPTRKRFDRFNGSCMLHIINLYDSFVEQLTVPQAQKIEQLIQNQLPLEAKSEISVLQWLKGKQAQIVSLEVV